MNLKKKLRIVLALAICCGVLSLGKANAYATDYATISANTTVTDTMDDNATPKWFTFTTTQYGYFTISFSHHDPSEEGNFSMVLKDADGTDYYSMIGKSNTSAIISCVPGQKYYIVISSSYAAAGDTFDLIVSEVAEANWEKEANGTQATATDISVNTDYKGMLSDGDVDYFKFTLPSDGYFNVSIKHTDIQEDGTYNLSLWDAAATELYDASGKTLTSSTKCYSAGTVIYIKVQKDWAAKWEPYILNVAFTDASNYETESNDTTSTADSISLGTDYYGIVSAKADSADYYKFDLKNNSKINLVFGPNDISTTGYWTVKVVDSKGNEVELFTNSTIQNYSTVLKKGTYYLKVINSYGAGDKLYKFNISASKLGTLAAPKLKSTKLTYNNGLFSKYYSLTKVSLSKKSADAAGYEVTVAKKKNMKSVLIKCEAATNAKTLKTFKNYKSNKSTFKKGPKKVYVQVRPYVDDLFGNRIYGSKSKVLKVKLKK